MIEMLQHNVDESQSLIFSQTHMQLFVSLSYLLLFCCVNGLFFRS